MSGYTVVLTGNFFDHVLRKTLGLPSLNGHEKLKVFLKPLDVKCTLHCGFFSLLNL